MSQFRAELSCDVPNPTALQGIVFCTYMEEESEIINTGQEETF